MALQATIGKLTEAIDTLKSAVKDQGDKLAAVSKDVHSAKVILWVVFGIMGFVDGIGAIALKAFFDFTCGRTFLRSE